MQSGLARTQYKIVTYTQSRSLPQKPRKRKVAKKVSKKAAKKNSGKKKAKKSKKKRSFFRNL